MARAMAVLRICRSWQPENEGSIPSKGTTNVGCKVLLSASLAQSREYVGTWFGDFRYFGRGTDVERLLKTLTPPSSPH